MLYGAIFVFTGCSTFSGPIHITQLTWQWAGQWLLLTSSTIPLVKQVTFHPEHSQGNNDVGVVIVLVDIPESEFDSGVRSMCQVSWQIDTDAMSDTIVVSLGVSSLSSLPTLAATCGCLTVWRVSPITIAMLSAPASPWQPSPRGAVRAARPSVEWCSNQFAPLTKHWSIQTNVRRPVPESKTPQSAR